MIMISRMFLEFTLLYMLYTINVKQSVIMHNRTHWNTTIKFPNIYMGIKIYIGRYDNKLSSHASCVGTFYYNSLNFVHK